MADTISAIEAELREVVQYDQTPKDRQTILTKLHEKAQLIPDDVWDALSTPTQNWINDATKAKNDGNLLPDFPDLPDPVSEEKQVATSSKTPKKAAASKKESAAKKTDTKKAAPSKPAADKSPAKKAAKPAVAKPVGEVTGVKAKIKNMILKKTDISTDEIVAKLGANGAEVSRLTVAAVRAEFRHSLRCIKQAGYLDQISI